MEKLEPVVAAIQYIETHLTSGELNLDIVADAYIIQNSICIVFLLLQLGFPFIIISSGGG